MKSKIYAVYDNKAEAYNEPFTAKNPGLALRVFSDNVKNENTIWNKHPNDFCLYEIGEYDDATGDVTNYTENKNLGLAAEYLNEDNELRAVQ